MTPFWEAMAMINCMAKTATTYSKAETATTHSMEETGMTGFAAMPVWT